MESVMCSSPLHSAIGQEASGKSPPGLSTPVRQDERKNRQPGFHGTLGGFNVLPTHITPPSGLTRFIARNPFDADLTSRLHLSVISPSVFKKVTPTPCRDSPGFSWSVDELALIQPAKIEEFPTQMHCTDPHLEVVAQAAIDKFFHENQIIPSPWDLKSRGKGAAKSVMTTPSRPLEDLNATRESAKTKKDCWTQTVLTLPPQLPKAVEEALKPYFTFNQDQNVDTEDANSSNNSLRRKLFFNHDDSTDDDEESSLTVSPIKSHGSATGPVSPPQGGMLVHGTPVRRGSIEMQRTHGTPCPGNLSPPNMSPITSNVHDMSCQSIRSRYQFASRLDFTADMSIDGSIRDERELRRLEDVELDTNASLLRPNFLDDVPEASDEAIDENRGNRDSPGQNQTTEMLSQETTPLKRFVNPESNVSTSKNREILSRLRLAADWCANHSDESYLPQNNTLLGHSGSGQQSALYSAQDTGYQTQSMSNMTGTTENCSITPVKNNFNWKEKVITSTNDEIQLSDWQDNMKNMFSSTPSKYSRRKDN